MTLLVQNLIDALTLGSIYALFALGLAIVFSIMNLVNFAHGELIMVGGYTLVFAVFLPWPLLVIVTVVVTVIAALGMERIAFRPVRGVPPTTLLVISFTLGVLLENLAIVLVGGVPKTISLFPQLAAAIDIAGIRVSGLALATIVVTIVLLVGIGAFLRRTSLGVQMRAAAEDFRTARIIGVRANVVIAAAFAMSGSLAAIASILLTTQTGVVNPTIGSGPVLVAFVAIVLGGMGNLRGAVLGGYFLGVATVLFQTFLPLELRYYRDAFVYAAVIVVLLVRPYGLLSPRSGGTRRI